MTFSLLLPQDELSVPTVRRVCGNALRDLGVAESCTHDIQLALTEACTNVLKHARHPEDGYEVNLSISNNTCDIRVIDKGSGFAHDSEQELVNETSEGGRGIHLMRSLVDNVSFTKKPESGTVVRLEKDLVCDEGSILTQLAGCPS